MKKILIYLCVLLTICTSCFVGCSKDVIAYKPEIEFYANSSNNGDFRKAFTENFESYEFDVSYPFAYINCQLVYRIYEYKNGKKTKAVFELYENEWNFSGCIDYKIINGEWEESARFIYENFFINENPSFHFMPPQFRIPVKQGAHVIKLKIPVFEEYNVDSFQCEIKINATADERSKSVNISLQDNVEDIKYVKYSAGDIKEYDFYIFEKGLPRFIARDTSTNEEFSANIYEHYYRIDCNGYYTYCEFDNYLDKFGLYLCEVFYLNSDTYQDSSYRCYIFIP